MSTTAAVTSSVLVVVFATVSPARADEPHPPSELDLFRLDDIVTSERPIVLTASRRSEPIDEAPAPVTVVTAEDIARFGWRTLGEILASLPGMVVDNALEFDTVTVRGVGLHGQYHKRVLVLLDGHTMNEAWAESVYLEIDGLDVSAIDRVEVVRGPSSALYGSNGFLAVVNIITRRAPSRGHEVSAVVQGGYPLAGRVAASGGGALGPLRYQLNAFGLGGGGREFRIPERADECIPELPGGCTRGRTLAARDWRSGGGVGGTLRLGDFRLSGRWGRFDTGLPMASYQTIFNDRDSTIWVQRGFAEMGWSRALSDALELEARAFFDWAQWNDELSYLDDRTVDVRMRRFTDLGRARWGGAEVRMLATVVDRPGVRDRIQVGVTAQYARTLSDGGWIDADPVDEPRIRVPAEVLSGGAFVENDLALGSWGRFVAGARLDGADVFQARLSPRAGVIVRPYADGTLRLLYGEGFRNPSAYEAFYEDGTFLIAADDTLGPEVNRNAELLWTHRPAGPRKIPWSITTGVYYSRLEGLIDLELRCIQNPDYRDDPNECPATDESGVQLDDVWTSVNALDIEAIGFESRLEVGPVRRGRVYLNMAVQSARFLGSGAAIMNSPHLVTGGGVAIPVLRDRLFVSLEGRLISPRRSLDEELGGIQLPTLGLIDANVELVELLPGLVLSVTGRNLLGTDHSVPMVAEDEAPAVRAPGPPRSVYLAVGFRARAGASTP